MEQEVRHCEHENKEDTILVDNIISEASESEVSTSEASEGSDSESEESDFESEEELELADSILKEIRDESYTCLVCTCEVDSHDKVWACSGCYRVYHIACISGWSQKGSSTDDSGNWKCPACNATHRKQKFQNRCWCKKVIHPPINEISPNSCGQTCGAKLEGCPHRCTLPCHPGPHASCNALGPPMKCHCGKHETQWPCVLTPYAEGWQCDDVCDEFLSCEIHKCDKKCHDGVCGKCEEFVESKCYCGETSDFVKCHTRKPLRSFTSAKRGFWIGNFQCSKVSDLNYDCNIHSDSVSCQPRLRNLKHCPLSPDVIKTCPCGQTSIKELNNGKNRSNCSEKIPTCSKLCEKRLACGHTCKWSCHEGECSPCFENVATDCRCGNNSFIVPCKFIQQNQVATCAKKCFAILSCRRHRCNKMCCPDDRAAEVRERARKRAIRTNTSDVRNARSNESFNIEATHICLDICNRKLTCGNPDHLCQRTCHAGSCPPCLESSNDDLICHCGQTVVMAPVRCGVSLPPCDSQCIRELSCGHSQMPHNCHSDGMQCPPCTKTVEKLCNCGKKMSRAMCYQKDVFCSERCGKKLPCQHHCLLSCHDGPCTCKSICGKKKKYCAHLDRKPCHFPSRCDDSSPCNEKVSITCKCGRRKKEVKCGADAEHESSSNTKLNCEISCALKEREEKLKEAFGIREKSEEEELELSDLDYAPRLLKVAATQVKWCIGIETMFKELMNSNRKTLDFRPMRRSQREVVHYLAEAYKLYSESHDPEPNRSVFVAKKSSSAIPKHSLSLAIEVYQRILNEPKLSQSTTLITSKPAEPKFNALLIKDCINGVTKQDVEETISIALSGHKYVKLNSELKWIEGDQYLLYPPAFMNFSEITENDLKIITPVLKDKLSSSFLAESVELVRIDENFNVLEAFKSSIMKSHDNQDKSKETVEEDLKGIFEREKEINDNSHKEKCLIAEIDRATENLNEQDILVSSISNIKLEETAN